MLFVSLEICLILIYSTFFLLRKKCATLQATFEQKPQIKINSFQNQKHGFLINAWSEKALRLYRNRALSSLLAEEHFKLRVQSL